MIPDDFFDQILSEGWDNFAVFAHANFLNAGRGVIVLDLPLSAESLDELQMLYVVYDFENDKPDEVVAKSIRNYEPSQEMIIQYVQPTGHVRTVRVKAPDEESQPENLWRRQSFGGASRQ